MSNKTKISATYNGHDVTVVAGPTYEFGYDGTAQGWCNYNVYIDKEPPIAVGGFWFIVGGNITPYSYSEIGDINGLLKSLDIDVDVENDIDAYDTAIEVLDEIVKGAFDWVAEDCDPITPPCRGDEDEDEDEDADEDEKGHGHGHRWRETDGPISLGGTALLYVEKCDRCRLVKETITGDINDPGNRNGIRFYRDDRFYR